jgi:WD40 repeat protein/serine/threonine protein kinase
MDPQQIEVRCPGCGARYWVEPAQLGASAECGHCSLEFTVRSDEETPTLPRQVTVAFEGAVQRSNQTITGYMREHGVSGGVSLEASDGSDAAREVLEADSGRKYAVGKVVAQGGMGAILNCRDLNVRRNVAMKVMLNPEQVEQPQILRFIEEAQVTGQLEHPGVVPVYELGVDAGSNVFYTMKFIRGRTLKEVIKGLADRDAATLTAFPLNRLLSLFQRVCEAVAYAHHKHVIHRDLKPENIMLGDFGEVYVMDWGLAKVLGGGEAAPSDGADTSAIQHARSNLADSAIKTLDGAVMGTPYYMAPEQARGEVSELDGRADVYALGGILYELLSLRRAVDGKNGMAIVMKVAAGEITPLPTTADPAARPQCPGGQIPAALAAVAMKALALKPEERYQTVKDLQADIEAYQAGFATSAENAGLGRLLLLFVKRHRTAALAAAAVVLALTVGMTVALVQWRKARLAETVAEAARGEAEKARNRAVAAEAKTQQAYVTLEQENYYTSITAADGMIAGLAFDRAEALLWKTPPALRGWEWGHLLRRCQTDLLTLRGHTDRVNGVVFSPDGKRMYSASNDGTVRVWEVQSGKEVAVFRQDVIRSYQSIALSPDGRCLATGDMHSIATLWNAPTGAVVREFMGHKGWVVSVAFSPDGRRLATAGQTDKLVKVWDVETGKEIRTLAGHESHVVAACFSPDGRLIASGSRDSTARIWEVETGRQVRVLQRQAQTLREKVDTVAFSPDGQRLAAGGVDGFVTLYDPATGAEAAAFAVPGATISNLIAQVVFSPDGQRLATASLDRTARIWDVQSGKEIACLSGHGAAVTAVAFSPDGRCLATASVDGTVKLWPSAGTVPPVRALPNTGAVNFAALSPDGRRLATAGIVPKVLDAETGQMLTELKGHTEGTFKVVFSSDGKRLVSSSLDKTARVWDATTGSELLLLQHGSWVATLAFSPDGRHVATAGDDLQGVHVWDSETGKETKRLEGGYFLVAFSPDSRLVLGGDGLGLTHAWEVETGREVLTLPGHTAHVVALAFSKDGTRLATGSFDKTVRIWEMPGGRELLTLRGHGDNLRAVAFSPDGRRLLTASDDWTVRLWDAASGREVLTLKEHKYRVVSAEFFPDGRRIMSASQDGDIRTWQALDWTLNREQIEQQKLERYQRWLAEK